MTLYTFDGRTPKVNETAFVAPNAVIIGSVEIGPRSSIWPGVSLRGDVANISIGTCSNLQDGCVIHAERGGSVEIGDGVSVGHGAILHGCRLGSNVLIGMGAIVMEGVNVEDWALIGAGALLSPHTVVPSKSLVLGVPGRVTRQLTDEDVKHIRRNAEEYVSLIAAYHKLKAIT